VLSEEAGAAGTGELGGLATWVEGAWARDGRSLRGAEPEEPSRVLWLTASPYFADLRVLHHADDEPDDLDLTQAFSGTVRVAGDIVTWSHDLDTTARFAEYTDSGRVLGAKNLLVEVGEDYEERWVRAAPFDSFSAAAELRRAGGAEPVVARMVVVADFAIAVWSTSERGSARLRREGDWCIETLVGASVPEAELPELAKLASSLSREEELPGGWVRVR
jgi:hypothetical protein